MEEKLYKNRDWLYQKYWDEMLSSPKIAKICKCGSITIRRWLKRKNIKIRTFSEAQTGKLNPYYGEFGKDHSKYRPFEERLREKVDKKDNTNECWPWTGYRDPNGYGLIGGESGSRPRYAHAVVYEISHKDKVGKGEVVHHRCGNPSCCNPSHLEKMTNEEHMSLHKKGEKNQNAKLTWEKVRQIRKEYTGKWGELTKLAKKYNVDKSRISDIINNKAWRE